MSNIDKQALRERYSPQPVPKCHICGSEMTIQRMSASRITYGCTGATYDDAGCHYTVGRSIADDHYAQSRITVVDMSDPDVLGLLDELEAAEKQIAQDVQIKARLCRESNSLHDRLREAEKRIAELEQFKVAFTEWLDKTEWVQTDKRFDVVKPWGKHRAEVLKLYIEHLEVKLETADKLQDSAFRHGLQHGFSFGQTDNQAGFEQCMAAYSQKEKNNG